MSDFNDFIKLLEKSKRVVVLSGAGVSTLSGIPDFRSSDGLYSKSFGHLSVEDIVSIGFFRQHPDVFYDWAEEYWYHMEDFEPNIIHRTLALMEEKGMLSEGIFTQNIDGLHERAGSKAVYNLHGTLWRSYCMDCNRFFTYDQTAKEVRAKRVPTCPQCGGTVKPDIVFYGEGLDMTTLRRGEEAFRNCDLCLVLGSSLIVNPAASLPYISARYGKKIVIVNRDETYLDPYCTMRFTDLESFFTELEDYVSKK